MDVAILVAHEIQIAQRQGDRLCTDTEKAIDFDNGAAAGASAIEMIQLADLLVIDTVDRRTFENGRRQGLS